MRHTAYWPLNKHFWLFLFILCLGFPVLSAEAPKNFSQAKRIAKRIHQDHRRTFYCDCRYDKHAKKVDLKTCGYQAQKDKRRARRIEWEHIVPVSAWGQSLPCWKNAICCKDKDLCYKGRKCCRASDPNFAKMEADLHNLVPAVGELNGLRSNYRFGVLGQKYKTVGACQMKVDPVARRVEPPFKKRGMVARAYLYMAETYGMPLSDAQWQLFTAWNKEHPPGAWEIERDQRIAHHQGNHNTYILHYAEKQEVAKP